MQDFKPFNPRASEALSASKTPSRKSTSLCEVHRLAFQVHFYLLILQYHQCLHTIVSIVKQLV